MRVKRPHFYGLLKVIVYLPRFVSFVFRSFPSARLAVAIAVLGVILEYAALSVMLPLASANGQSVSGNSSAIIGFWHAIAAQLGLPNEPQTWLWLFLLLLGLRIAVGFTQVALNTWVSKLIHSHLSGGTFSRVVMYEPLAEIYRRSVGHYIALAGDEAVRAGQVFFHLAQMLSAMIAAAIGLVVLLIFSPLVFKLTLLFLLLSGLSIGVAMKWVFSWSNESALLSREAGTTFIEAFNGIRSIRSMAGEEFVAQRYRIFINRYGRVLFFLDVFNHGSRALPGLILIALGLVVLFPSAGFIQDFSAVYFFTVTTMLIRVLSFLGTAVSSGGHIAVDIRAAFELDDILGKNDAPKIEHRGEPITRVRNITFSNLDCGYSAGHKILSGVTAQVSAGRSYAVVGKSGSGKSTLADVFLGLLLPQQGELQIDGISYKKLDMSTLRRHVVLVEQQTRVFSGSLRENVTFGLTVSDEELQSAVDLAGLSEFVLGLPSGLDTILDYQGANLSGGQRQRVGLARALVRQPDVLILDEATSALDGHTRDVIVARLHEAFRDRVLIFITHDEKVSHMADEVWCIENGALSVVAKVIA